MPDFLKKVLQSKYNEVASLQENIRQYPKSQLAKIAHGEVRQLAKKDFKQALLQPELAIIAEIKRQSPSKGQLAEISDPILLAQSYVEGGANALSVLTESKAFAGSVNDLEKVAHALRGTTVPVLRKDFIVDELQIAEAIAAGADAILLIVTLLGKRTKLLLEAAHRFGVVALVEVHSADELKIALDSGAEIIGINNRDLTTLQIDTQRALQLVGHRPASIIKVAESGILEPPLAQHYYQAGFNAVLIGEGLVKANVPARFISDCRRSYEVR